MSRKPRPAPIFEKRVEKFRLHFCIDGKQYRHAYIKQEHVANILQSRVNSLLIEIKTGLREVPSGRSIQDFIFSSVLGKHEDDSMFPPEQNILTLSDLIESYLKYLSPPSKAETTCRTERIHLGHLGKFLSFSEDPLLQCISVGYFNRYKQYRYSQGIRTDTVSKELGTFHNLFRFAIDEGWIGKNPIVDVRRDKSQISPDRFRTGKEIEKILQRRHSEEEVKEIRRFRYLTEKEIAEILDLLSGHWLYPIIQTFAYTGMRRGELLNLEWHDVDFVRKVISVRSKKQSSKRQCSIRWIDIPNTLCNTLWCLPGRENGIYVFTGPGGDGRLSQHTLVDAFKTKIKGTKFQGIGFHAFRHSLASNLAAKGIQPYVIDEILGHQTEEMRERYRHLFPEQKRDAVESLNF